MGGAFFFTQTVNQGLCQVAQLLLSLSAQIFLTVVVLPGKGSFRHFRAAGAFVHCFGPAQAFSLTAVTRRRSAELLG